MADGPVIIPNEGRQLWLTSGEQAPFGAGTPAFVLFSGDEDITVDSVYADFTLADFSGYSGQTVTLGSQFFNGDGYWERDFAPVTFTHDGGGTGNSIYGWLLVHDAGSGGAKVVAGQNFDPARDMSSLGNEIVIALNAIFLQCDPP